MNAAIWRRVETSYFTGITVTGVEIFQDRNDVATLIPMLNGMLEKLGRKYSNFIADSGYESEENYQYLGKSGITPYINPQSYELWKKTSFKKDIKRFENMRYLEEADAYVCANDRILWSKGIHHKKSASGYRSELTFMNVRTAEDVLINPNAPKHKEISGWNCPNYFWMIEKSLTKI